MNTKEFSPKTGFRLNRIRKVSGIFKAIFFVLALASVLATVLAVVALGWAFLDFFRRVSQPPHFKAEWMAALAVVTDFISAAFTLACYKLFDLYSRGDLFTAEVVRSIRRIGVLFFFTTLGGVLSRTVLPHSQPSFSQEFANSVLTAAVGLFSGILVLFIAWVMDEGRKIQEEQELTV
jgi:hypothetical protein